MSDSRPKVSIGLPVYNGENYLRDALDSILGQTFTDFEVIICDNASTDKTAEICRDFMKKDVRIRYFRNEANLGAAGNFNRTFELSRGEYFKWAAHDDLLDKEFLAKCVEVLDSDQTVVLCFSKTIRIDENGKHIGTYQNDNKMKFDAPRPHERFREIMDVRHWTLSVFGVIRSSILIKTPLIGNYVGSDRNLVSELGLTGRVYRIPEYLFSRRDHPGSSVEKIKVLQDRLSWFDTKLSGKICFPNWRNGLEYFKSVRKASLSATERLYCYLHICNWHRKRSKWLYGEVLYGTQQVLSRSRLGRFLGPYLFLDLKEGFRNVLNRSKTGRKLLEMRRRFLVRARMPEI